MGLDMLRVTLAALALLVGVDPARAQDATLRGPDGIALTDPRAGEFQFRPGLGLGIVQPVAGGLVTGEGAVYGYAGISIDIDLAPNLVARPSLAPGLYQRGDGRDLGGELQFRSGFALDWKLESGVRLGFEVYHISNFGLREYNPGSESALLTFTVPLR